jgi:dUTP pyrophosphatase
LRIQLIDFGGKKPLRAHENDAGADVFSPRDLTIFPGQIYKLPLGFGLRLPDGFAGYIFPRSGLSTQGIPEFTYDAWVERGSGAFGSTGR